MGLCTSDQNSDVRTLDFLAIIPLSVIACTVMTSDRS